MYSYDTFPFWGVVLGGLGLFLYGINSISKILKTTAGTKLQKIIDKCSKNKIFGVLVGAGFTAIIQSSGATSALAIGLVRAGLMTLIQAAAVIVGANVGTTITAFIISLPLNEIFPILIFIAALTLLIFTSRKSTTIAELMFSLGAIFLGLLLVEKNLSQLANLEGFKELFITLNNYPILGLIIGTLVTAVLQSSSAVIGVLQGIYAASLIGVSTTTGSVVTLYGVLPILFGANIGTCSVALISSIGGSKESKRVALFHLFYNTAGALFFMIINFIFKDWLSSSNTWYVVGANGTVEWIIDPKFQLAIAHLVFNLVTAIIFVPSISPVCKLLEKIIKSTSKEKRVLKIKELDVGRMKKFPGAGIALAHEQVLVMSNYSKLMFETIGKYIESKSKEDSEFIHQIEESIDRIDRQINEYLLLADRQDLSASEIKLFAITLRACKDIERIGDYGENLIGFYENVVEKKEEPSEEEKNNIVSANNKAIEFIVKTIEVLKTENKDDSISIVQERRTENEKINLVISNYFEKYIDEDGSKSKYTHMVFVDIMNCYQRVFSHCSNIAKLFGNDKENRYSEIEAK